MTPVEQAAHSLVEQTGDQGLTMGQIVDRLVADGAEEREAEMAIWSLIGQRLLTPNGFFCRKFRAKAQTETLARSYEFVLIAWSPEHDRQLEAEPSTTEQ